MFAESLELKNFRNYESLNLSFDRGTNVFYGDNAQGKTNILEAISVLATTKSHRGSRDQDMIRFGENEAHLRIFYNKNQVSHKIDMHLKRAGKKGAAIDGLTIRRAADLYGQLNIVFFSPVDLNIIKNGPAERRRFMDSELSQLDHVYISSLTKYNKVLEQRNALLKEIPFQRGLEATLDVWDEQIVHYGIPLIEARKNFIEKLNPVVKEIHRNLTDGRENIELIYEPNVTRSDFSDRIMRGREKDIRMKTSTTGPHRDDFEVRIGDIDIRRFGSQGQQRSAALSLKLSEINLLKEITGDYPLLLLDDVLSELDSGRQKMLLSNIANVQTFITCTGMDDLIENRFQVDKAFHVVNGRII
ncbi:MAG: DNA replication/repair protein RecF [Bilifractor sp.]|jgi:DNA replication and repair protein RecF